MCPVRPAETIRIRLFQIVRNLLEIVFRNNTIRVEKDLIFTFGTFHTIIPGQASARIRFEKVTYIQLVFIFFDYLVATNR